MPNDGFGGSEWRGLQAGHHSSLGNLFSKWLALRCSAPAMIMLSLFGDGNYAILFVWNKNTQPPTSGERGEAKRKQKEKASSARARARKERKAEGGKAGEADD